MRIAIDSRCLNSGRLRGMGKAMLAVLDELLRLQDVELLLLGDEPRRPMFQPDSPRVRVKTWEVRGDRFRTWEQVGLPWEAWRQRCDVLHAAGTWAPMWQPVPTVVTVHDTIPWESNDDQEERLSPLLLNTVLPNAYRRARIVLTPSVNSQRDILRLWPELGEKVEVLPWGVAPEYTAPTLPELSPDLHALGVTEPYLLYMGGELPRKRLEWAIKVWHRAVGPEVRLVVCGLSAPRAAHWREQVPEAHSASFLPLPYVEEHLLPGLYSSSIAVLYPTLYEGFGFPALEAQALGRPIFMSAVGSLRELAGPSAHVLPTEDLQAWVDAVRAVVGVARRVDEPARRWAEQYSWPRAAAHMADAYRRAARMAAR